MKSLLKVIFCGLILCFSGSYANAIIVSGNTPPSIPNPTSDATITAINGILSTQYNSAISQANTDLQKYGDQPELAKGFANANAYAAQAGTLQGYQDYDIFAITTGIMLGAQLPSSNKNYYDDLDKKIKDKGDLYAGVGVAISIINVGINAGFIYPGLYLNAKFGYFSNDSLVDNLSVKTTLVGLGANYTWIKTSSLLAGVIKWRGISFGTGFLYSYNKIDYKVEIDDISRTDTTSYPGTTIALTLDPSIDLGVKSSSYSIPFDVTTSVRLLWFINFNLGAGIDFNFGTTDIKIKSDGNIGGTVTGTISYAVNPGSLTVDGSTKDKKPSWIRERITTGIGFNISVVKIDVPVIIYPFDSAIAVGLTAGVVW
jgi:hypothetical protein